ncbi:N-(5'-phosphoribosyl)anthranilate isomerase [Sporotomaculum syntrophicum]|uniref:N-(5'-phosphoribosyl)anthranilate isomerase n=1 Tax=Sporotomaculum syntrophicum TaxID=182264 RepID=A0A9D2WN67_9FIRM|nr:phosphoribosylanthranilate isomerase [Sporotomaculum syntrophicum]KAF1084369.1 N-(5'-phosphoribosyl)anthranilate isomerase [Sporotomaculum syntrophicum]
MTKIKICGLTRREDIEAVNRWLPEYVGFVFARSRRQVTPEQAALLKAGLDARVQAVGVFVNAPVASIAELCYTGVIDVVQLHGDESEAYIKELKEQINCPVIKAVRVRNAEQVLQAEQLSCDMLLLDTYQKDEYGGSGKTFDYALVPDLQKRFWLAGGLENSNLARAIEQCRPYGVDLSSGVETDGLKDEDKIRQVIKTVRSLTG